MRSSILAGAALAAGVMAVPHPNPDIKVVYDTEVHYATVVVTVTAGQPMPSVDASMHQSSSGDDDHSQSGGRYRHHGHHNGHMMHHHASASSSAAPEESSSEYASPSSAATSYGGYSTSVYESPESTEAASSSYGGDETSTAAAVESTEAAASSYGGSDASTSSAPEATESASATYGGATQAALDLHNEKRAIHHASDLEWTSDLENSAKIVAEQCSWTHNTDENGGGYGQNYYMTTAEQTDEEAFTAAIEAWYEEVDMYDFNADEPSNFEDVGHFTQMVWKATSQVGCYKAWCGEDSLSTFVVCNYKDPGNVGGGYTTNVLPE